MYGTVSTERAYIMAKRSVKVAVTYTVTILITLLIAGGICYYLFDRVLFGEKETEEVPDSLTIASSGYEPSASDDRTVLLILDAEKRQTASCFVLARFLSPEKQLVIIPLPSNTCVSLDGTDDTLYNFYRNGGSTAAVSAVESATEVSADKYIRFGKDSFENIVDIFGGVNFDIPYNLIYDNPDTGEETIMKSGTTFLDSSSLRKVLTYPNYNAGEEYRAKCAGLAVTDMINGISRDNFESHLDDYFTSVINSDIETNITAYDYEEISDAMKYVIKNADKLSTLVPSSGEEAEDGHFVLDSNFVRSITEWFKLYDYSDDSVSVDDEVVFPED